MKLFLDPQIYYFQTFGGISRYYTEIFSILSQKENIEVLLPVAYSENAYLRHSVLKKPASLSEFFFKTASALGISTRSLQRKQAEKLLVRALNNTEYDLFVPTYYNPFFLRHIHEKPFVLTVYDMIHELFPEYYQGQSLTVVRDKLLLMEKATMIIAVSQNTKKDILSVYPHIDASKIEVIYHGSSINVQPALQLSLPQKYILFVGERANYKNFKLLLEASLPLLKRNADLFIVCAGGEKFKAEEASEFQKLGVEHQLIHRPFQEQELGTYYANALCFVFPSLYEGFGIPVLEAMTCGCPVVLGRHSSFPEVAGEAGVYFDSNNVQDLTAKIELLVTDHSVRNAYAAKGLQQSQLFKWSAAAEQCLNVYKKAVAKHQTL